MTAESLIKIAYARLAGMSKNIPENIAGKDFVDMFHAILDDLETLNCDLSSFRVPDSAIRIQKGILPFCDSLYLKAKVDGLLVLFTVSEDKKKIGFESPQ